MQAPLQLKLGKPRKVRYLQYVAVDCNIAVTHCWSDHVIPELLALGGSAIPLKLWTMMPVLHLLRHDTAAGNQTKMDYVPQFAAQVWVCLQTWTHVALCISGVSPYATCMLNFAA